MRLMAQGAGLWLDADVLLLKPVEIDQTKPYFAWERPRRFGNSVLYLPASNPVVAAFTALMAQDELTPDWLSRRHRMVFAMRRLCGGSNRVSDLRVAIYGPPALTALAHRSGEIAHALPKQSFYAVHAEPEALLRSDGSRGADRRPSRSSASISRRRAAATRRPSRAASTPGLPTASANSAIVRCRPGAAHGSADRRDHGHAARNSDNSMKASAWRRRSSAIIGG